MKNTKGFTLIEVLVVISVIGLLASVVIIGLGGFRSQGRDARRIADLRSVQNGLELYYVKNQFYPDVENWTGLTSALQGAGIGITRVPKDPQGTDYLYGHLDNNQGYIVAATLEATAGDPIFNDSYQGVVTGYSGSVTTCAPPVYCVVF